MMQTLKYINALVGGLVIPFTDSAYQVLFLYNILKWHLIYVIFKYNSRRQQCRPI